MTTRRRQQGDDGVKISVSIPIKGSKEDIWKVISDIEHSEKNISAIHKIEVLERPKDTMIGFKWRETRTMFGKEATEVMWVTDFKPNTYYKTRAESHGMIYVSELSISEGENDNMLTMSFEGEATSSLGRFMSGIFGKMMKNSTKKALEVDLQDIKRTVEEHEGSKSHEKNDM